MFGISWGGFNRLQIAALAPEPLKAVVTVCSTDDRYDNDVHYMGGSVLAVDMHAWAATMLAFVARPPDPAFVGEKWREMWLERLEAVEPFIHTWLAHQTRDDYWKHGSVCEDYAAIDAAVLAVGGWHDPYRDTVLRLVEHLPGRPGAGADRPLVAPVPGPGAAARARDRLPPGDPALVGPPPQGRGDGRDEGAAAAVLDQRVAPAGHGLRRAARAAGWATPPGPRRTSRPVSYALRGAPVRVRSPQHTGLDAGRFFPFGNDARPARRTSGPRTPTRPPSTSRSRRTRARWRSWAARG